jgi:hypothetical protein
MLRNAAAPRRAGGPTDDPVRPTDSTRERSSHWFGRKFSPRPDRRLAKHLLATQRCRAEESPPARDFTRTLHCSLQFPGATRHAALAVQLL